MANGPASALSTLLSTLSKPDRFRLTTLKLFDRGQSFRVHPPAEARSTFSPLMTCCAHETLGPLVALFDIQRIHKSLALHCGSTSRHSRGAMGGMRIPVTSLIVPIRVEPTKIV